MYPFSIQVACNNGTFIGGNCLSETFVRAKNTNGPTGAIASAGSSILMAWAEPMDTEDEIGDIISDQYTNNKKYTLGGLFYNAQMHMLDAYPTSTGEELMETWVLFGDPSCMFRSLNPTTITASHAQCLLPNTTTFSVTSTFGPNAYASISQNNQIVGAAPIISANTNVVLTQTYSASQNLILTITDYNKIPYTATLTNCIITDTKKENVDFANFSIESPIKDELTVNYKNVTANELTLVIFDLQGKLMMQSKYTISKDSEGTLKMDMSNLVYGVYLLKINDNNNVNLKVVKAIKN